MMRLEEKIAPAHTALLVIDMQKDFAGPGGFRDKRGGDLSMAAEVIGRLPAVIEAARQAGVAVLYTQQIYDRTKLNPLQLEQYDLDGKAVTCDIAGDGWHFYGVQPPEGDVFVKYNYNAFSNPELENRLAARGIKTLVIAGMDTFYCVETAIRNGFDLGYKIVVAEDLVACNGKHRGLHERTLQLVEKSYGVVVTAEALRGIWSAA